MSDSNLETPAELVAIIVAAKRSNNRELERKARRVLKEEFNVSLHLEMS